MNAQGMDIISLAIGSPDMPPSDSTIETLCNEARKADAHGYQPTVGIPQLRQAMANFYKRWYGVELNPNNEIQPLIGSKEGILHVTLAFVNPGDGVLVPNPGYPTYTSLSKLLGARIVNYDLLESNGWQPDFEQLEKMDLTGIKLMWTNYPNMPTRINDIERIKYMRAHIMMIARAINRGIPVTGYYTWSIMDTYEHQLGFTLDFGLIAINYETMERTPRDSFRWYRDFITEHTK